VRSFAQRLRHDAYILGAGIAAKCHHKGETNRTEQSYRTQIDRIALGIMICGDTLSPKL